MIVKILNLFFNLRPHHRVSYNGAISSKSKILTLVKEFNLIRNKSTRSKGGYHRRRRWT
ncbi:hypothetical protein Hanom_Chr15g01356081 [Helianthus anomalus]